MPDVAMKPLLLRARQPWRAATGRRCVVLFQTKKVRYPNIIELTVDFLLAICYIIHVVSKK